MINIELVYAKDKDNQVVYALEVPEHQTIAQVIAASPILQDYPEIQLDAVGIWSTAAKLSDSVQAGDRIEIYRPLPLSAMEARLARKNQPKEQSGL